MSLTVTCVFVHGEYPYTVDYVTKLWAMVDRWIDRPYKFVCLTDQPWLFQDVETIPVQKLAGFAPWTKLELFNPIRQWKGRVLYLDLDSLIVASLAPIIDYPAPFALTADPPKPGQKVRDSYGRRIMRRFNSSVMCWDGGTQTSLYTTWTPDAAEVLSGDQDWIGEQMPDAAAMSRAWFPRLSEVSKPPFGDAKVILAKVPKNAVAVNYYPWFEAFWGAA